MEKKRGESKLYKLSTFSGVFIPSTLAIFGAVMYLILPRVLGGIGLVKMLGIIILAHSVSVATAFSLSAITTNIKVKGGGLYYLISRSLGSEFGGGLGIQLFLAQSVGISFYSIAFAIGLNSIFASFGFEFTEAVVALIACALFGILAWFGAKLVIKVQTFIFVAIILSLVSIFLGSSNNIDPLSSIVTQNFTFWVAFAMFFPAVTGIDAGVGMSGDLKNPKKSLVKGTFIAIFVTFLVYILLAFKLVYTSTYEQLFTNPLIISQIAIIPALVILGVLLATSSSAISYFMAAPRTLKALSDDNIFSSRIKFLGSGLGNSIEPRVALLVSLAIAMIVIGSGDLGFVSQIVTIFFLNVYGWINAAAFFEKISMNPSFRPSFNSPGIVSFYGMAISYIIMYLFNPWIMIVSILFQLFIFLLLLKTKSSIKLESVWDGVLFQLLRKVIKKIETTAKSKKNWRPTIVAFCADRTNRNIMLSLLDWIGAHSGIVKFYYLVPGKIETKIKDRTEMEDEMKRHIRDTNEDVYPRVIKTDNFKVAMENVLQSETIGNLPPNTAFIHLDERFKISRLALLTKQLKKNVIILRNNSGFSDFEFVDVWWDDPDNGNLMILLAYLITHSKQWMERDASIRLFKIVSNEKDRDFYRQKLNNLINDSRIDNITLHIILETKKGVVEVIKENSNYADLVLLGFPHKKHGIKKDTIDEIKRYTEGLTTSLIVLANDKIDFRIN